MQCKNESYGEYSYLSCLNSIILFSFCCFCYHQNLLNNFNSFKTQHQEFLALHFGPTLQSLSCCIWVVAFLTQFVSKTITQLCLISKCSKRASNRTNTQRVFRITYKQLKLLIISFNKQKVFDSRLLKLFIIIFYENNQKF